MKPLYLKFREKRKTEREERELASLPVLADGRVGDGAQSNVSKKTVWSSLL
jgi:hypothetical protein